MTSLRRYRFIAGAAVAIAALGGASDAHAYVMGDPPAPTPEVTAPPGPDNPQARVDWWTVTSPWSVTTPTSTAPPQQDAPVTAEPSRPARRAHKPAPTVAEPTRQAQPAATPKQASAPRRVPRLVAATRTGTWYVAPGETLDGIARANGTTWRHLQRMNEHQHPSLTDNPGLIRPGWHLTVPQ